MAKKKYYDEVELVDFKRIPDKRKDYMQEDMRLKYKGNEYMVKVHSREGHIYVIDFCNTNPIVPFDSYIGSETTLVNSYDYARDHAKEDPEEEIMAALIGFLLFKAPKNKRDVWAMNIDAETREHFGDIISEL